MVFTWPLMVGIQLVSARIGRVTGQEFAKGKLTLDQFAKKALVNVQ